MRACEPRQELRQRLKEYDQAVRWMHQAEHRGDRNAMEAHRQEARELQESIRTLRAVIATQTAANEAPKEWGHFVQETQEQGGGLVQMATGTRADMEKLARKGGMALPLA